MKDGKGQKIDKYNQSKPAQLELFELLDPEMNKYSNTVELYDIMPKFYFGGVQREKGKFTESLPILEREFKNRDKAYSLNIKPAAIKSKEGKTVHYYPSQREELVEDVIRKLATKRKAMFLDTEIAVSFTLYEVRKELEKMGHGYNINEIKEAIQVCNNATVEVKSQEGNEISISSNIFPSVFMESKDMESGKNKVVVMLHPLITKSINEGSYRLINYEKMMKMKMPLARWIHRRISHLFSQATINNPYTIKISTIIRDSGMKKYKTMSECVRQVVKALEELKKVGTLERFEKENRKEGNKILDVLFSLYTSKEFVADAKKANAITNNRHAIKGQIQEQSFDLESLRAKISDVEFGLTKTVVNNIVAKIKTVEEYEAIDNSLSAARNYIEQLKQGGKKVNSAAIVQKAIKEGWIYDNSHEKKVEEESKKQEKKIKITSNKKQEEERARIKAIEFNEKKWLATKESIKDALGQESFEKWFREVEFYNFVDGCFILKTSKFVRDWINRELMGDIEERLGKGVVKVVSN